VKCNLDHASFLAGEKVEDYVGRIKNFRIGEVEDNNEMKKAVLADVYLANSARISPRGNLFDYILAMAANDSDMFGLSIVFSGRAYRVDLAGAKVYQDNPEFEAAPMPNFVELENLYSVDFVSTPAANDKLFSAENIENKFSLAVQNYNILRAEKGLSKVKVIYSQTQEDKTNMNETVIETPAAVEAVEVALSTPAEVPATVADEAKPVEVSPTIVEVLAAVPEVVETPAPVAVVEAALSQTNNLVNETINFAAQEQLNLMIKTVAELQDRVVELSKRLSDDKPHGITPIAFCVINDAKPEDIEFETIKNKYSKTHGESKAKALAIMEQMLKRKSK
jgi:hypothetical protein